MINNIKYVADRDIIISYEIDGEADTVLFSDIKKYWEYASSEEFESGQAWYIDNNKIMFTIMIASAQAGVIVIWNAMEKRVEHISNADFCIDAKIKGNMIYQLKEISFYGMPTHYCVETISVGIKDFTMKGDQLYCQNPRKISVKNADSLLKLRFAGDSLLIDNEKENFSFVDNVNDNKFRFCAEGYENIYRMLETVQDKALHNDLVEYLSA